MVEAKAITIEDDLESLVEDINRAAWDKANDIGAFGVRELSAFLNSPDTVFVACYEQVYADKKLRGIAPARIEIKPYGNFCWLYIDEVDVCADYRNKGAGKAIMRKLFEIAKDAACQEIWLGTEVDNQAANALYRSFDPDEVEQFIGYTFETD